MEISVLMTTYNGEKYILQQMDSILNQTMIPDEVIIIDDNSSDKTFMIIETFKNKYKLEKWKIIRNNKNIGWKKNFKKGLDMVSGIYIFLCDQDDIWDREKIERMYNIISRRKDIDVLASNFKLKYENNKKDIYYRNYNKMVNDEKVEDVNLSRRLFYVNRPGCTYCVKKSFYNEIKEYWNEKAPHDEIFWIFSCVKNTLKIYNYQTIEFRRHGNNNSGLGKISLIERREQMYRYKETCIILKEYMNKIKKESNILEILYNFFELRMELFDTKKISILFYLILKYSLCYSSIKGWLRDFYLIMIPSKTSKFKMD